jgi:hypothetical protein
VEAIVLGEREQRSVVDDIAWKDANDLDALVSGLVQTGDRPGKTAYLRP